MRFFVLGLVSFFGFVGHARAWGEEGHRIIAALAAQELSPAAQQEISKLLAGEPEPTLPGISFWADEHKNRYTAPMHYVNMPAGLCKYEAERDCPDGRCVVAAIDRYSRELSDLRSDPDVRAHALKMLVHLVGDAHQPLHAGLAEDRGGNKVQLQWQGRGSNLHRLWDSQLIEVLQPDWLAYSHVLIVRKTNSNGGTDPVSWVEASCRIVNETGFYPAARKVGDAYLQQWKSTLDLQMLKAGHDLAELLNASVLAPRPLNR